MLLRDLIPVSRHRPLMGERRRDDLFRAMRREMNRMFGDLYRGFDLPAWRAGTEAFGEVSPRIDVSETEEEIQVTAELPGVEEKEIDVTFSDGMLTISGEHKEKSEEKDAKKQYYLRECSYGAFRRVLPIGDRVDDGKFKATFRNGVLTVVLPKTKDAEEKTKRIPVTH